MTADQVTAVCITYNQRETVERMLDSFERTTPRPCRLSVGDNGSTDGVQTALTARPFVDWTTVPTVVGAGEQRPPGASAVSHGAALDLLVHRVTTPYVVTIDSDVTFTEPGWLEALVEPLQRYGYQAVGEYEAGVGGYQPRLAVHLLALSMAWWRAAPRSFRGAISFTDDEEARRWQERAPRLDVTEDELGESRTGAFFATGALVFRQLVLENQPWGTTPAAVRRMYRHHGHASWPSCR